MNAKISDCLTEGGELNLHVPGIGKCYKNIKLNFTPGASNSHILKTTSGWNCIGHRTSARGRAGRLLWYAFKLLPVK